MGSSTSHLQPLLPLFTSPTQPTDLTPFLLPKTLAEHYLLPYPRLTQPTLRTLHTFASARSPADEAKRILVRIIPLLYTTDTDNEQVIRKMNEEKKKEARDLELRLIAVVAGKCLVESEYQLQIPEQMHTDLFGDILRKATNGKSYITILNSPTPHLALTAITPFVDCMKQIPNNVNNDDIIQWMQEALLPSSFTKPNKPQFQMELWSLFYKLLRKSTTLAQKLVKSERFDELYGKLISHLDYSAIDPSPTILYSHLIHLTSNYVALQPHLLQLLIPHLLSSDILLKAFMNFSQGVTHISESFAEAYLSLFDGIVKWSFQKEEHGRRTYWLVEALHCMCGPNNQNLTACVRRKSDFFRDLASCDFAETYAKLFEGRGKHKTPTTGWTPSQEWFDSWHPHLVLRPFIDASGLGTEVKKVKLYPCYDIDKWLFIYTWSLIWKRSATAAGPGGEEGLMGVDIWKGVPVKLFKVQEAPVTVYT